MSASVSESRPPRGASPQRLCAGCRAHASKHELVRFAVAEDAPFIAPDPGNRLPGRGVSIHPRRACLEMAVKRGGFAKAVGKAVPMSAEEIAQLLIRSYERRIEGLLMASRRTGRISMGTDAVRDDIRAERAKLLVVARDAAGRREEILAAATRLGRSCVVFGTKSTLGELLGRGETGVLAILDEGIAREIADVDSHIVAFSEDE